MSAERDGENSLGEALVKKGTRNKETYAEIEIKKWYSRL